MGIFLDSHYGSESKSAFVKGLAEVGPEHTCQDPSIDGPEELLARLFINVRDCLTCVGCSLHTFSQSPQDSLRGRCELTS